ncbi:hypothetical protein B0T17DRAFT_615297 [Bombardia bombarda]|uniref:DUF8021 domain-containing protein n=1 Tax=Bombardia bombarda TaxID=252184 RepID=A0AA39X919_9PEZI|nr:hypothetical protein B0T17DRAFT_615297 [Bombardia bombarda]
MIPFLAAFFVLGAPALALPTTTTTPSADGCTRDLLRFHTEQYINSQIRGDPSALLAIASPDLVYNEDGVSRSPKTGVTALSAPLRIDHNRSSLDTTQCATYTELIVSDPANPRVIGTQLRFDPTGQTLVKVESLVSQPGDWAFNATQTLSYASSEDGKWTTIPEAERDTRAVIQAAADAYLNLFNNPSEVVPWGTPCNVGVPSGVPITNRRYVIDETLGTVDALVQFATRPDSHEFRVEGGKIKFVHTLTIMRNVTL